MGSDIGYVRDDIDVSEKYHLDDIRNWPDRVHPRAEGQTHALRMLVEMPLNICCSPVPYTFRHLLRTAMIKAIQRTGGKVYNMKTLAKASGVPAGSLSLYNHKSPHEAVDPSLSAFLKLCSALRVSPDEFLHMKSEAVREAEKARDEAWEENRKLKAQLERIHEQMAAAGREAYYQQHGHYPKPHTEESRLIHDP